LKSLARKLANNERNSQSSTITSLCEKWLHLSLNKVMFVFTSFKGNDIHHIGVVFEEKTSYGAGGGI